MGHCYTVESVQSWQGPQANRIPWMRVGLAASATFAKGLEVTLNKNNQGLHVPHGNHQKLFPGFLKAVVGAFPFGQAQRWYWVPSIPMGWSLSPASARRSRNEEGAAREWVKRALSSPPWHTPIPQQGIRQVRPGQQQSPWLIFKEEEAR